jgi:O-antigen/teichoic acid export membrane protein
VSASSGAGPVADPVEPAEPRPGLARSTFVVLQADVAQAVSDLAVAIVVARALGPANRGVYFLAVLTATLVALFGNLGTVSSAIVFGANRRITPRELHGLALAFSAAIGAVGAALLLGLQHVWLSSVLKGLDRTTLVLISVGLAPLLYAQIVGAMLYGAGYVSQISGMRIGLAVANPLLMVPAALVGGTAVWAVAAWVTATSLFAVALFAYTASRVARPVRPSRAAIRRLASFSARGHVGTLAHQGFLRLDVLFVSARLGPRAVGLYSQASVLAERMSTLGHAMYSSSAPRLGSDTPELAAELAAELVRVLLLILVPVAIVLAALAHPIMVLIFGDAFAPAAVPFAILLPGAVCLTIWYVLALYIMSSLRRPGMTTIIQGTGLLVALPLYWWTVRQWGYNGAAVASTLVYAGVFAAGLAVLLRSPHVGWRQLRPTLHDVRHMRDLARAGLAALPGRRG